MILSAPAEGRKQIQRPTPLAECDLFSAPCMWGLQVGFLCMSSHFMSLEVSVGSSDEV